MINTDRMFYVQVVYCVLVAIISFVIHPFLILMSIGSSFITYMITYIINDGKGKDDVVIGLSLVVSLICLLPAQLFIVFRFMFEPFGLMKIIAVLVFIFNALLVAIDISFYKEYNEHKEDR